MTELNLCPFCGGEATILEIEPHTHIYATFMPDYEGGAFIECEGCAASISGKTAHDATESWNRRAEPAPLPVKREKTTVGDYRCPTCGVAFIDGAGTMPYCGNCGQRLEWGLRKGEQR